MKEVYTVKGNEYKFKGFTEGKVKRVKCDKCVNGYELVGISTVDVCRKCGGKGVIKNSGVV